MSFFNIRRIIRDRRLRKEHIVVGIDQSFSNYAMVKFVNGVPTERCVYHTGDPNTIKNKRKDPLKTNSQFFVDDVEKLNYLYGEVLSKLYDWNPDDICMEGLSFGSSGNVERQLGALFFGMQVSIMRELGYEKSALHVTTPKQCKSLALEFLIGDEQFEKDKNGNVIILKSTKKQKNKMSKKSWMIKALKNTKHSWILDGYTRDGLVSSRDTPTGLEDLPDAYFIGLFCLETKFKHIEERP